MAKTHYEWQRFWHARDTTVPYDYQGYLDEQEWLSIVPETAVIKSFDAISTRPCLILLGEPGMGKSTALQNHFEEVQKQFLHTGDKALWFDMNRFQSDSLLRDSIFKHPDLLAWRQGVDQLALFLDGLDESLLHIKTVAALLAYEIKQLPASRLVLRIACRSAEWVPTLEAALREQWSEEQIGVYDLAPLRRLDVQIAATTHGILADVFLTEVERIGIVPLAIKPITLEFLLKTYKRDGQLPTRQTKLFHEGCRLLCAEFNQGRRDAGLLGNLSTHQRFRVAEYIAYLTIFANRTGIWTAIDDIDVPDYALSVSNLVAEEIAAGNFDEPSIRETLRTGLFKARGLNEIEWTHHTYAEFLAASYIVRQKMPRVQILSLLQHADDAEARLVPQLHGIAAWLANLDTTLFRQLMLCDPEAMLRSDVATAQASDRAALVDALLDLFDREQLLDSDALIHKLYRRLAHPDIAAQLQPIIQDMNKGFLVRRVAIGIAEACNAQQLLNDLTHVALDEDDLHHIRVQAAWAVVRIGDASAKVRLRPLAFGTAGVDTDDDLRGCGLLATWPNHLSVAELFEALQNPKQENYYGSYKSFLVTHCVQSFLPHHLPFALRWVAERIPNQIYDSVHSLDSLGSDIMECGWTHLESPGVLDAFAEAALARLSRYDAILGNDRRASTLVSQASPQPDDEYNDVDEAKRRGLVTRLLPALVAHQCEPSLLIYGRPPLLTVNDIDWLIEQFTKQDNSETQTALASIIVRFFLTSNAEQFETLYTIVQQNKILAASLEHIFGTVELYSEDAVRLKTQHQQWQDLEQHQKHSEQKPFSPPPAERIRQYLEDLEAGDLNAWWRLNVVFCFDKETRGPHRSELEPDLRALPGWNTCDEQTRSRLISAAQHYVLQAQDEPSKWRTDADITVYRPTFAAYRALLLLLHEDQTAVMNLPATIWKQWAAIIVGYPISESAGDRKLHQILTAKAYTLAPVETIEALLYEIDKNSRNERDITILWKFQDCWNDALATVLLDKVQESSTTARSFRPILRALYEHVPSDELQVFTASFIIQPIPEEGELRRKALTAAIVLLTMAPDAGWSTVWLTIQTNPSFGRELIETLAVADDRQSKIVGTRLSENEIANLFIWLECQFPRDEDPKEDMDAIKFHEVTPREVRFWRDALLTTLKNKGTPAAVRAIQRIHEELPNLDWLRWSLLEAKALTRQQTWSSLSPQELIRLAANPESRTVQSGKQLLDVIMQSLERLQQTLSDETPTVFRLWNETPDYRPKDEERLSDEIKRHLQIDLQQRGIVVNREVVIRPTVPNFQGERLDIKVQALASSHQDYPDNNLSVIIEVKGCWNKDLPHAMQTQLCDRYLSENTCQDGIYVVGWFNCLAWTDKDYRKAAAHSLAPTLQETREQFQEQAQSLTGDERTIRSFVLNAALPQSKSTRLDNKQVRQRKGKPRKAQTACDTLKQTEIIE